MDKKLFMHGKQMLLIGIILGALTVALNAEMSMIERYDKMSTVYESEKGHLWFSLFSRADEEKLYEEGLAPLKDLYTFLVEQLENDYYEINRQYLEISNFTSGEIFLHGYEYGDAKEAVNEGISNVKAFQLSHNCFTRFDIKTSTGRGFLSQDYHYKEGASLPILLGDSYRGFFQIGDKITANYIFKEFDLEVVGFLSPNACIQMWGQTESLDNYMIMPSFSSADMPKSTSENYRFQVRHYWNKVDGYMDYENIPDAVHSLKEIKSFHLDKLYGQTETLSLTHRFVFDAFILANKEMAICFGLLCIATLAAGVGSISLIIYKQQKKNILIYYNEYANGETVFRIRQRILSAFLIFVIVTNILSFVAMKSIHFPWHNIVLVASVLLLISLFSITRINISFKQFPETLDSRHT